ncbi:p-hydroxybenzoic acid efflux pump subunit AaeB [BD1-7 clade bacterium]|uniref:p-hydroxybenzoic acid efflux pump subunit AaeB n=1 Tax=BD1-7 clade bacterium TaxID=2029982 RepID=A0A5S9PNL9_9GAMM|nr:p-hydroxybenzoic acid efflux pump subunit AaeB [BD1-7 clade bacterium]
MVACIIVMLVAFSIDLANPSWGLLTVSFIGLRPDIGSLWTKSVARVSGTLAGGLAGVIIMIVFGDDPIMTIISLSVWVALCSGFITYYKGMAGYGGFLSALTAMIVVVENVDNTHIDTLIYFAIDRVSEIILGVFAITLSAALIFPQKNHRYLQQVIINLKNQIDQLADSASITDQKSSTRFIHLHESTSRKIIEANKQRYYTAKLDIRIARISGSIERLLFEYQSLAAVLIILRHHCKRDNNMATGDRTQDAPQLSDTRFNQAIQARIQKTQAHAQEIIDALASHRAMSKMPRESAKDTLIRVKNYRDAAYKATASFLATAAAFVAWSATADPQGALIVVGAVILIVLRASQNKSHLDSRDIIGATLHLYIVIFLIQFVILIHTDSFYVLAPVFIIALIYIIAGAMADPKSMFWRINLLFFSILMPITNPMTYDAADFTNRIFSTFVGFMIAYLATELVRMPSAAKLLRDDIVNVRRFVYRAMKSQNSADDAVFRQEIMNYYLDALNLDDTSDRVLLIRWFNAINIICVSRTRLVNANLTPSETVLFDAGEQFLKRITVQIDYPGSTKQPFDNVLSDTVYRLLDDAQRNLETTGTQNSLSLMMWIDAMRRYYESVYGIDSQKTYLNTRDSSRQ